MTALSDCEIIKMVVRYLREHDLLLDNGNYLHKYDLNYQYITGPVQFRNSLESLNLKIFNNTNQSIFTIKNNLIDSKAIMTIDNINQDQDDEDITKTAKRIATHGYVNNNFLHRNSASTEINKEPEQVYLSWQGPQNWIQNDLIYALNLQGAAKFSYLTVDNNEIGEFHAENVTQATVKHPRGEYGDNQFLNDIATKGYVDTNYIPKTGTIENVNTIIKGSLIVPKITDNSDILSAATKEYVDNHAIDLNNYVQLVPEGEDPYQIGRLAFKILDSQTPAIRVENRTQEDVSAFFAFGYKTPLLTPTTENKKIENIVSAIFAEPTKQSNDEIKKPYNYKNGLDYYSATICSSYLESFKFTDEYITNSILDPYGLEIRDEYTPDREKINYINIGIKQNDHRPYFEMYDYNYSYLRIDTSRGNPLIQIAELNNGAGLVSSQLLTYTYVPSNYAIAQHAGFLSIKLEESPTGDKKYTNNRFFIQQHPQDGCEFEIHLGKSYACNDLVIYQGNGFKCVGYFSSYLMGNYPLIENTLDDSDPKPARLAIRRHTIDTGNGKRKAISLVCQCDDGIEFLVARRIIGENNESQINEENFKKFLESDTWKIITDNYKNSNK